MNFSIFIVKNNQRQNNRQGLLSLDGATSGYHPREGRQTEAITLLTVEIGIYGKFGCFLRSVLMSQEAG